MKLKNKKTGAIVDSIQPILGKDGYSIKELNEEWEDVPTEEVWYLGERIGNYSMPKKEARKATEKILAWKRLKDKGFRFCGHDDRDRGQLGDIVIYAKMPTFEYDDDLTRDDLDLLFGGEE